MSNPLKVMIAEAKIYYLKARIDIISAEMKLGEMEIVADKLFALHKEKHLRKQKQKSFFEKIKSLFK
jgi:hypothetical protein